MSTLSTKHRVAIVATIIVLAFATLNGLSHGEPVPIHQPLHLFPLNVGDWRGEPRPFEEEVVAAVGVDDYLNNVYKGSDGTPLDLYIGYYESQRKGDLIHSPKNCLPGAGWEPVSDQRLKVAVAHGHVIEVNEYIIAKGLQQQLVLYWYQSHGRVVASEYWGKVYLVADAITLNRTDGSLIRVITPIVEDQGAARQRAVEFVQVIFPLLKEFIPE